MKTYTKEELAAILTAHSLWLKNDPMGKRADLSYSDLRGSDLRGSNLRDSNLSYSTLSYSNLSYSNLSGSDLRGSNLRDSNLRDSNLSGSDLRYSNLSYSDLRYSDLRGSNLRGSDLRGSKNSELVLAQTSIVPEQGAFEGWKKCNGGILVRVLIPAKAKRSSATGRKCRAEFVKVLEVVGAKEAVSKHDGTVKYVKGKTVKAHEWGEDRFQECAGGIHFFLTRIEAENYN